MDLSWCTICDNHIDDTMTESSLYCSPFCQAQDLSYSSVTGRQDQNKNNNNNTNTLSQSLGSLKNLVRLSKIGGGIVPTPSTSSSSRTKRPNGPSTSYPWELLYTRPRNKRHVIVKRCQPMVSSSYTNATAMFAARPSIV